jgi:peptidoglycan hydrolase-like protein with peptidoglycan-binding domain
MNPIYSRPGHKEIKAAQTAQEVTPPASPETAPEAPQLEFVTIPENITVHLGAPDEKAENVTVPFIDYIKNVASSELYPTWPENAIRANIYAIVSIALNRVFTEWYRSRGYNFDITNSTQYDQAFVFNRGIFDTISTIADEIFNDYIVRERRVEPLFAQFCDGRISQCSGMYQWGSVDLAEQGYTPLEILQYYYGTDIEIVENAPVGTTGDTYPGPLKLGDTGAVIYQLQLGLNDISANYTAIPKIIPVNGVFTPQMEAAIRVFQKTFNLPSTGIIDKATWYRIRYVWVAVRKLAELVSQGLFISEIPRGSLENLGTLVIPRVQLVQYYLNVLSAFYKTIPAVEITGVLDAKTRASIIEFQKTVKLPSTGIIDNATWDAINNTILGIFRTLPPETLQFPRLIFPGIVYKRGSSGPGVVVIQELLAYISSVVPNITKVPFELIDGEFGPITESAVRDFEKEFGLTPDGVVDEHTWNVLVDVYRNLRFGEQRLFSVQAVS